MSFYFGNMIKAIIFDFDGVIADTYELNLKICRNQGRPDLSEEEFKDHHNGNVFNVPAIEFTKDQVREFYKQYYELANSKYIFPIHDELRKLVKEYSLYVVTSNSEKAVRRYIELGNLKEYFKAVLGMESSKLKTDKFKMIFSEFGLNKNECIFVTDTSGDVLEAKTVGLKVLGVSWGYHSPKRLLKAGADKIVENINDIDKAIKNI